MPRSLYVLSPCGTSLLTNQADGDERKRIGKNPNAKYAERLPAEDRAALTALIQRVEETMETVGLPAAKRCPPNSTASSKSTPET